MIRALLAVVVALAFTFLLGTPLVIYAAISGETDPLYWAGRLGARATLWAAGVKIDARGLERIPRGHAVVFMSNHQSNIDPPAVFVLLPPVLVLGKQEFFRVPVLGRAMRLRGFVPIDRQDRERAIEAVNEAAESLKAGHSFLVFAEGTRSPDGRLLPFKKGPFVMALKAGAPIVPVSISGAFRIMPKGGFAIHPGRVRITFHDPVQTAGCTMDDRGRIMESVRRAMLAGLTPEEWPLEPMKAEA